MAVYTEVSDEALGAFLADYDLGRTSLVQGHRRGRREFQLSAARPKPAAIILTLYEKRVSEADLPFFLGLMEHLAATRRHLPAAGAQRATGAALGRLARAARRRSSLFSTACRCAGPTRAIAAQVGEALARMHKAGARFCRCAAPTLCRSAAGRRCSRPRGARADEVAPGLADEIARRTRSAAGDLAEPTCPAGVIHADLFPDNVFFLGDKLSGPHRLLFRLQRLPSPTTSRSASTPGASSRTASSTSPRARR